MQSRRMSLVLAFTLSICCLGGRAAAQPTPIRVGYLPATHDALLFIARERKLFDESRIEVKMKSYDNSVQILTDLKSSLLDVGIPGVATPATEIGGRAPLSIVGGAAAKSAALVATPSVAKEMKRAGSADRSLLLLKGRKVGAVRGSTGLAVFRQALARLGVGDKSIYIREFSKPPEIISALVAGDLDAGLLWSPHMTLAEAKGLPIALWMSDLLPNHVCCRQVVRDDFIGNGAAVTEYLVGLLKADRVLRRARTDTRLRGELILALRKYLPTLSDEQLQKELFDNEPRTTVTPALDAKGIENYLDAMKTAGLMRPDECKIVVSKIRGEFLEAAYRKLGCPPQMAKECAQSGPTACPCTK